MYEGVLVRKVTEGLREEGGLKSDGMRRSNLYFEVIW